MSKLVLLPAAQHEYETAVHWYAERSAAAANRFAIEVEAAIDAIHRHPDRHGQWDDKYRYYQLNKFPYFVAYRQAPGAVVVVAIRHGAQEQEAWRGR